MPIHDWTRVRSNRFHDFHQSWTIALRNALNGGRLPPGYFAMVEQKASGPEADVITLEMNPPLDVGPGGVAVDAQPPKARFVARAEAVGYAHKANRITVRHPDGDVVAILEIVSPGNKDSKHAIRAFARKATDLLRAGVNLLIVDLFPPSRRDPPPDKPLTVVSYAAGTEIVAYVEPVAVGDCLPEMPIFLAPERYIPCPLETAYLTAWEQFPAPLRGPLES